jgi:hypothetical protein
MIMSLIYSSGNEVLVGASIKYCLYRMLIIPVNQLANHSNKIYEPV